MKSTLFTVLMLVLWPGYSAAQSGGGVTTEWDLRQTLDSLSATARRVKPILDKLTPQEWVSKGASATYVAQWKQAQNQLQAVLSASAALSKQPERLTVALDAYFQMESLDMFVKSLAEGCQSYQNPAIADLLRGVLAENSTNRDKLRQYISDLADIKEKEFQVMDHEAQRCRGILSRQPSSPPKKKTEKK